MHIYSMIVSSHLKQMRKVDDMNETFWVCRDKRSWFRLKLKEGEKFLFKDLLTMILNTDGQGIIYIRELDPHGNLNMISVTYGNHIITFSSDDRLERIHDCQVIAADARMDQTTVNYHVQILKEDLLYESD